MSNKNPTRDKNRKLLLQIKSNPCTDCQQKFPSYVMQFDHLPGAVKEDINRVCQNKGIKALTLELAKCELVCAACHKIRTYSRGQFTYGISAKTKKTCCDLCQRKYQSVLLEKFKNGEKEEPEGGLFLCPNCNLIEKERHKMGAFKNKDYHPERFKREE